MRGRISHSHVAVITVVLGIVTRPAEQSHATDGLSLCELLRRLQHPESATQRLCAAEEIATYGDRAVPALCDLLRHQDRRVRSHACLALTRIGPAAGRAVSVLTFMAGDCQSDTQYDAVLALSRIGPAAHPAVPVLGGLLETGDPRVRRRVMEALAAICTPGALNALTRPLAGAERKVKMEVLRVLQELGPSADGVTPILLDAALKERDPFVCDELYLTLGTMGDAALDDLLALFERSSQTASGSNAEGDVSRDPQHSPAGSQAEIRRRVAMSLSRMTAKATIAVPTLERALFDADATVRFWAARALDKIGPSDFSTRAALMQTLTDPDADVRWAAAWALRSVAIGDGTDAAGAGFHPTVRFDW